MKSFVLVCMGCVLVTGRLGSGPNRDSTGEDTQARASSFSPAAESSAVVEIPGERDGGAVQRLVFNRNFVQGIAYSGDWDRLAGDAGASSLVPAGTGANKVVVEVGAASTKYVIDVPQWGQVDETPQALIVALVRGQESAPMAVGAPPCTHTLTTYNSSQWVSVTATGDCWSNDVDPDPNCELFVCLDKDDICDLTVDLPNAPDDEYSIGCDNITKGYYVCSTTGELKVCH